MDVGGYGARMTTYPPTPPQRPAQARRWPLVLFAAAAGLVLGAGATAGTMLAAGWEPPVADPGPVATAPDAGPTEAAEVDPYDVWLERAPDDAPELSRDDALARAQLGCDQEWPPGTTDAILQEVYADHIQC